MESRCKTTICQMQEEIAKWPQGVLAQGVWFQAFHNSEPNKALDFMTIAMEQTIKEPENNQMPSNNGICTGICIDRASCMAAA